MDSLTQAVLGATVGEVVLGKKVGNKAPFWGAVAGTIPDLDVVLNFFVGEVQSTIWHRTFSHSLLVLTLVTPVFGYLVFLLYRRSSVASFGDWSNLFFWGLITHPLLDSFTNYGTMIFYPLSDVRVAWRTIFIVDPLYTLPLLFASIAVLFMAKTSLIRKRTAVLALSISTFYLFLTIINKINVNHIVEENLKSQSISHQKYMTSPTFFNNLLWSVVVKADGQYYVGYYSLLDDDKQIDFSEIPQQKALLLPYLQGADAESRALLLELIEFTEYFYALEPGENSIYLYDLRFGKISGWFKYTRDFIFSFHIQDKNSGIEINRTPSELELKDESVNRLLERTLGK
ncbi:inner membrane protein [Catalinimonas alkaloidigena]|uniref:metal-dependent hydrolase n=1 Tax=Catalinimonas alkaloidigena TaxID=1075417 RepID=UPI002405A434|nr:metal-dependent hydrolase [Catalinimonas alkaloidigena]MDF9800665.1 inner membrane protein [Catalinimonas alkaloidigena]